MIRNALKLAVDSLRAHRLRSFLTLLGVIIGVGSVILVGSAIDGLGLYADESVSKAFGSESFVLQQVTNARSRTEYFKKLRRNHELKLTDERYLEASNSDKVIYSAYRNSQIDTKRNDLTSELTTIIGAASDLADIRDMSIVSGRFFSQTEDKSAAQVAVIGDDLKNNLFPNLGDPIGHTFKIQGIDFTVVGILERMG
jgi:putative ABC transport system permease protein